MNETSATAMRQRILIGAALGVMGVYAFFSVLDARSASVRLSTVHGELNEVKKKLREIESLSAAPSVAALESEPPGALNDRIDTALKKAGLPPSGKLSQDPLEPRQIDRTQYKELKTIIKLAPATLPKIVTFCDALRDEDTGSVVSDLSLSPPTNSGNNARQELWGATLTLTQTIYSPKSE